MEGKRSIIGRDAASLGDSNPALGSRRIRMGMLLSVIAAAAGILLINRLLTWEGQWIDEPVHSSIEAFSSLASILLGFILIYGEFGNVSRSLLTPALGLMGMGILDAFHAFILPGHGFILMRIMAALAGGIGFALVWFPFLSKKSLRQRTLWGFAGFCIVTGICGLAMQNILPPRMTSEGLFTPFSIQLSMIALFLYLAGAVRIAVFFLKTGRREDYLLTFLALFFILAQMEFANSMLWTVAWWEWHFIRLLAGLISLGFLLWQYMRLTADIKKHRDHFRKQTADLEESAAKLEAINKELEAFSYSVSHDLRAPLRAIDGFSKVILDTSSEVDETTKRYLNIIRTNTQNMGKLIDDLLSFSRIGKQAMRSARIDMESLAAEIFEQIKLLYPSRVTSFSVKSPPTAHGDIEMIRIVLSNLLTNAVKFTGKKPEAAVEFGGNRKNDENIYYVKDNGAGFDMKYANKLFGVFQRLHSREEYEGTGVGLALAQRVIHRHGGRVWAEGKVNEGAAFYFTLPVKGGII